MNNWSRNIAIVAGLAVFFAIIYYFSSIVAYVLISWVVSLVGQPLMRFFRRWRIGRLRIGPSTAALLTIICIILLIVLLGWVFVPVVIEQANTLSNIDYYTLSQTFEQPLGQLDGKLRELGILDPGRSVIDEIQHVLRQWFNAGQLGSYIGSILAFAGHLFILLGSVVFISFFFLKEEGMFVNFLVTLVPPRYESHIRNAVDDSSRLLTRYFGGIVLQVTSLSLMAGLTLSILGVNNAILIAFLASILNIVPYIGFYIGVALSVVITITSNLDLEFYTQMLPLIVKVLVFFLISHLIDNFILQPVIFSNRVLAHPLEIFIVILIGAHLYGITGMVLAIPTYTVIRVIARVFLSEYRLVQKLTDKLEEIDDPDHHKGGLFRGNPVD